MLSNINIELEDNYKICIEAKLVETAFQLFEQIAQL